MNTRSAVIGRSLRGGVAGSLATGIAGQVVLVASGVLAARALGVEGRGDLAAIVLVPSILIQLGTLGMPLAMTYYVARDPEGSRTLLTAIVDSDLASNDTVDRRPSRSALGAGG